MSSKGSTSFHSKLFCRKRLQYMPRIFMVSLFSLTQCLTKREAVKHVSQKHPDVVQASKLLLLWKALNATAGARRILFLKKEARGTPSLLSMREVKIMKVCRSNPSCDHMGMR